MGVPPGHHAAHARDGALNRRPGPVGGEHEQDGGQRPVPGPDGQRRDRPRRSPGRRARWRHPTAGRSSRPRSCRGRRGQAIRPMRPYSEHRPRGARERRGVAGEEHAQALADDPDAEHPGERHRQRGAHRALVEQADADEELDEREERVPHHDVGRHEVPDVGDEVAEDERLAAGVAQNVGLHEAAAEHEGLELQGGIEDPEEAENDLQGPLRPEREGEAAVLLHLLVLLCPGRCPCPALRYRRPCGWRRQAPIRAVRNPGQCSWSGPPPPRRASRRRCRTRSRPSR